MYRLDFPNHEVKKSLTNSLLNWYIQDQGSLRNNRTRLVKILRTNSPDALDCYFSVGYCYFTASGLNVQPEVFMNHGRLAMAVLFENRVYLINGSVNFTYDYASAAAVCSSS